MGIFRSLFSKEGIVETNLIELYSNLLVSVGMNKKEARDIACNLLESAKDDAKKEGTTGLPPQYGDRLLANEPYDKRIKDMLAPKRAEGVTNNDIREWWNLHDLERRIMLKYDDFEKTKLFIYYIENPPNGLVEQDDIFEYAAHRVKKIHPYDGIPEKGDISEDRLLPVELKNRINKYIESRAYNSQKYKDDVENSSSYNAFVRNEIKNGRL